MKRLALLLIAGTAWMAAPAYASNPNHPQGCHGKNNVPCRPDPQPTHGNDCQHSDDHSCEVSTSTTSSTTTTTSTAPTTTTTRPAVTTTTTVPTVPPSPTTTIIPPLVVTQPLPASSSVTAGTPQTAIPGTTSTTDLAVTGAGTDILVGIGLWLIVSGAAAMLLGKIIKG